MLTEWGAACLVCLLLTLWDRDAAPWAALILGCWLLASILNLLMWPSSIEYWPLVSLLFCVASLWLLRLNNTRWKLAVHLIGVFLMLLAIFLALL